MSKCAIWILLVILISSSATALTVYNSDQPVSGVGGTTYWASRTTIGDGTASSTRVMHKQEQPGSNFYRPGQTAPEQTFTITSSPQGYGWATDFAMATNIDAGTWSFRVTTTNSRSNNGAGVIGINVFSYCGTTNTRLFFVQGTTNVLATSSQITQTITTSQPAFTVNGCRLKFEYWLTATSVEEDQTNTLQNIDTSNFYVIVPTSGGCQDADSDGYTASSCGGTDCNDNNAAIRPGATETCNNIDDNCNGQTDENLQSSATCGIGACFRTQAQTCSAGTYTPACIAGTPVTEICGNGIDDDCNGVVDNGCSCAPGAIQACGTDVGACMAGNQTCSAQGTWGTCTGAITPITEICGNSLDDDCNGAVDNGCALNASAAELCNSIDDNGNGQIDENIQFATSCGIGACNISITQTCTNGVLGPACVPKAPKAETCNNKDDDCDMIVDEDIQELCGVNVGQCRPGIRTCFSGEWDECIGEVKPKPEICDLLDNNCNNQTDEGTVCIKTIAPPCAENWTCGGWDECKIYANLTHRNCTDSNACGTEAMKPPLQKTCFTITAADSALAPTEKKKIDDQTFVITIIALSSLGALGAWIISVKTAK